MRRIRAVLAAAMVCTLAAGCGGQTAVVATEQTAESGMENSAESVGENREETAGETVAETVGESPAETAAENAAQSEAETDTEDATENVETDSSEPATGEPVQEAGTDSEVPEETGRLKPRSVVTPGSEMVYGEEIRKNGAVLVNKEGKRFVNELEPWEVLSEAIFQQTDGVCDLVFDEAVREKTGADAEIDLETYIAQGIVVEADTVEGLAETIGIDPVELVVTMELYAMYQEKGTDSEFGRSSMAADLTEPNFFAVECVLSED